jgi:glycosyltransferase involved in cell wall biosynthesis
MKVVHFITRLIIGGAQENTLLTVLDQQQLYGDRVTLITGPGLGPEGSLVERAQAESVDIRIIPELRRNINPFREWASYRHLVRLLCDIQPEIVHTHSTKAGILGRAAAAQLGIPAVHTVHGATFHRGQPALGYRVAVAAEKWAHHRCQKVISVCDAMTDQYVAAGLGPREKYVTIYSGMEVESFLNPPRSVDEVRRELGFRPEHVVIGKVARLFNLKGHEYVLRSAPDVIRQNPNVRYLFVGDGILREQFEQEIARAGLSEHFVFTGLVPPARIPELIGAMDVVVHTSLREGLARVLPQALIAGKPVVTYDIDGAREVAIPGVTGYLLPPESVTELTAALNEVAGSAELRQRLGQTGRERFTDQFRHQTMTHRIREVYQSLLGLR